MKASHLILTFVSVLPALYPASALAVDEAEDIATTIKLRGYDCPGRKVQSLTQTERADGGKQVDATCSNGKRYRITVDADGRLRVTPR